MNTKGKRTHAWVDGQTDRWTNRQIDRQTDRWTDILFSFRLYLCTSARNFVKVRQMGTEREGGRGRGREGEGGRERRGEGEEGRGREGRGRGEGEGETNRQRDGQTNRHAG